MKKAIILSALIMLLLFSSCYAEMPEKPSSFSYVFDYADVISTSDEYLISLYAMTADNTQAAQVIVVTVNSLSGMSASDYATDMINSWGIGRAGVNDGILILLAPNERVIQLETGSGISMQINGERCGQLIDAYAIDLLANDCFSEGLVRLTKAVCLEAILKRAPLFDEPNLICELL